MRSKNEPKSALKNSSQKGRCLGKKPIFRLLVIFLLSVFYFLPTVSFAGVLQKPPNNLGLVGYWSFNEATGTVVKDYSGNNNDGTTTSTIANPPTSTSGFTSGKRGNAMKFDGINDYVQVLNSPSLAITGDITIAGWIKKRIVANNNFFELFTKGNGTVFDYQFYICDNSSCGAGDRNKLQVWSDAPGIVLTGTTQILDTNWHHIAFTRSGTAITIYLDGVSNASGSNGTAFNNNTVNSQIGYDLSGAGAQTDGNIDEVRLYNRGLSATEIYALYKSGAAKVNAPQNTRLTSGLVGMWSFNGADTNWNTNTTNDVSGNGNTGTMTNMATSTAPTMGKVGQALLFDGVTNDVVLTSDPIGTNSVTVCAWFNPSLMNGQYPIIGNGRFMFGIAVAQSRLQLTSDTSINEGLYSAASSISANIWQHACATRTSGGTGTIYINGAISGSSGNTNTPTAGFGLSIGAHGGGTYFFQGGIDETRIYNRTLSAAEVKQLYLMGAAKVNAPQNTRLTSGLVGMWSFNGADTNWNTNTTKDVSGNGNTGTMTNMATSTTPAIGKVGQALTFGGANTSVTVANESNFDFSRTQPFSISTWIYRNTNNNEDDIVEKVDPASSYRGYALWLDNDTCYSGGCVKFELLGVNPSGCSVNGECISIRTTGDANTIPLKTWKHIVATYDGSSVAAGAKIYIDGALFPTELLFGGTLTTSILNNFSVLIGDDTTTDSCCQFDGRIDETRIYNRTLSAAEVKQLYLMGK